mgnify:CR=1 FL=1
MPVTYNSFNLAFSSVAFVVSSSEEFDTTGLVEEFVAIEAFDDCGEELAVSRSMHFKHGRMNSA